jgi:hypothetical protein
MLMSSQFDSNTDGFARQHQFTFRRAGALLPANKRLHTEADLIV